MSEYKLKYYNDLDEGDRATFLASNLAAKANHHYLRNDASSRYYREYYGIEYINRSPILFQNTLPVLMIPALCPKRELHFANEPTEIVTLLEGNPLRRAMHIMIDNLVKDAAKLDGFLARLKHDPAILRAIYGHIYEIKHGIYGFVDLRLSEAIMKSCLRKSYKSLVNWGKRNLELRVVDKSRLDSESFQKFKELHVKASGRKTRSDLSWLHQYDIIKSGYGFLMMAYYNRELVSGCFIMHDHKTALYGVAASNRDLMSDGLPLNHYTLWMAIMNAQQKGCQTFILGDVDENSVKNDKAKNLALFKRGFATNITVDNTLDVRISN